MAAVCVHKRALQSKCTVALTSQSLMADLAAMQSARHIRDSQLVGHGLCQGKKSQEICLYLYEWECRLFQSLTVGCNNALMLISRVFFFSECVLRYRLG